jgi:hypothetical protein
MIPKPNEDEKPPAPNENLSKKQLDALLSSSDETGKSVLPEATKTPKTKPGASTDRAGGRTVRLAATDLPDKIVQTLKMPAFEPPPNLNLASSVEIPPPPPPPPEAPGTSTRKGKKAKAPTPPPPQAARPAPPVTADSPTAELRADQNPLRKDTTRSKPAPRPAISATIPDTVELPPEQNPLRARKNPTPPAKTIPDEVKKPEPSRQKTWRLPAQEVPQPTPAPTPPAAPPAPPTYQQSTWELPYAEIAGAVEAGKQRPDARTVGPTNTTVEAGKGPPIPDTIEVSRPKNEPRRAREPSWARFAQVSGSDPSTALRTGKGAPHGELRSGSRVGPMKIEALLTRGSGFTRYLGTDPDNQPVLVEVASASSEIDTAAFVRNAQAVARVDDQRLARLVDAGEEKGLLYTVYEGYRWRTAEAQLARLRPKADRSARIIRDAALGLAAAHGAGLQHGTLSLTDLLVEDSGRTRLVGLGRPRTRAEDTGLASSATFAAPELASSTKQIPGGGRRPPKQPTAASDQWSLSAILYTLVALAPPRRNAPFLRDATLACPPALESIATRGLARRPEHRYVSLSALAADLERFLAGAAIEAPAVSGTARLLARTGRLALLGAGGVALAAAAVAAVLLSGPSSATLRARELARDAEGHVEKEPRRAEKEWREATSLAPRDAEVLRAEPRVLAAVAVEDARGLALERQKKAETFAERALDAMKRASQLRADAEDKLRARRRLDPQAGTPRTPGAAWAKVELERRALDRRGAAAEGEAWAWLLLSESCAKDAGQIRLEDFERERLFAVLSWGEPATVAFEQAAASVAEPPRSHVVLRTTPPGAEVVVERYVTRGPRLVASPFDAARPADQPETSKPLPGRTPVELELPPGSYVLHVRRERFKTTHVPIYIPSEGRHDWDTAVELLEDTPENAGWVLVPRGPAWFPERQAWVEVGAFLMREKELPGRGGRPRADVSIADARAAAAREGARLPLLEELEKAWRGVDGRRFPWGNGFDLGFVKGADPDELPLSGSSEADVSPYGIRDLAGSLREVVAQAQTASVVGGSYAEVDPRDFELRTFKISPSLVDVPIERLGIRLVKSPPRR